ncbi:MAG TPA: LLM class F420-dependent oxidoreductase [Solirubrobacterales bacterium]|jgi:probable F420-dependent oxidoreductase|nr:LLM class F420-dependent oxidoreductase [Solirubrobacterales bacterium]
MDFGVSYFPTDESVEPAALARMAEERGFESVFVTEHTHIPASRETDYPAGGELPREYWRIYDPFVALTTMAAATERIRVGTAICLVVEHDPISTAKRVASLDRLSGARMLFGVGAGWNLEEMRNHGTDPAARFRILRERVEACKEIWTNEEATYHGEFVNFDRIVCRPAPLQEPHPPILVGGHGPRVLDRVIAFGDAWFPNRIPPDDAMIARVEELQRRGEEAGRGPIPVTLQIPPRDLAVLERYEQAGVTRSVHMLRAGDAADPGSAERKLDEWAERIQAYTSA